MESSFLCSLSHELRGLRKLRSMGYYEGEKATEPSHFVPASGPLPCVSGDQLLPGVCSKVEHLQLFCCGNLFYFSFLFVGEREERGKEGGRERGSGEGERLGRSLMNKTGPGEPRRAPERDLASLYFY